jgi:hypothetical protein
VFSEEQIPLNCECKLLYLLVCRNVTRISQNFPTEVSKKCGKISIWEFNGDIFQLTQVVMIDLANNGISLDEEVTFGSYNDLRHL